MRREEFAMRFGATMCVAVTCLLVSVWAGGGNAPDVRAAVDLVPSDAAAAVVIPSIKRASDDVAACLEGMERANVLVGSRPIDHLRAALGLTAGVDETRPCAIVVLSPETVDAPLYIVPVTDAADFLESNFDPSVEVDEALVAADGTTLFSRALDGHVILSKSREVVAAYQPAAGMYDRLVERLGERAVKVMQAGDLILYGSGGFLDTLRQLGAENAPAEMPVPASMLGMDLFEGAELSLGVVNLDPLGVGITTISAFDPQSALGKVAAGGISSAPAMSRLPAKPFYFAASLDLSGMGGTALLDAISGGMFELPAWIRSVRSVQFAASPSALGIQGGILNEATLVLVSDDPAAAREFMKEHLLAAQPEGGAITWEESKREIEGVMVDAYAAPAPADTGDVLGQTIHAVLVGRAGLRGFVGTVEGSTIVTFSQRPDVFAAAAKAAAGPSLAQDAVVKQMSSWLPPDPDIAVFFGLGQFGRVLNQFKSMIPMGDFALPEIPVDLKPIAMGMSLGDARLEGGIVLPADVLALILDTVIEQLMGAEQAVFDEGGGE